MSDHLENDLLHITICANLWDQTGVSRVRAILRTANEVEEGVQKLRALHRDCANQLRVTLQERDAAISALSHANKR